MQRFWDKVKKTSTCWIWTGSNNGSGYGEIRIKNKKVYTHRLSYEWAKGRIPIGFQIDHLCRNRACCNPDHLEAVTPKVNVQRGDGAKPKPYLKKDYCINGHLYSKYEYKRNDNKGRNCSECVRKNAREYARRKRLALKQNFVG